MRYLNFRPIVNSLELKIKTPKDYGYYYKITSSEFSLIKNTLDDNGFRDYSNKGSDMKKVLLLNTRSKSNNSSNSKNSNNTTTISNNITVIWTGGPLKSNQYSALSSYQKVNHFPKSTEITRKDNLYRNLTKLSELTNSHKEFNFIPLSFILPNELPLLEKEIENQPDSIWIIKPVASSQGRGIYLTNKIKDINRNVTYSQIACKYIKQPYLINEYKFDLRIYFMLTSIEPLKLYMYNEGLVRFATEKYVISDPFPLNNKFMHLTNYAINKDNKYYQYNNTNEQKGSKWSLTMFKEYLESKQIDHDKIFNKIKDIAIKAFISGETALLKEWKSNLNNKNCCFELFGFDILLDKDLNPWLLEINLTPSLNCDSQIDLKIKSSLVTDIFNISMIIPPQMQMRESEFIKKYELTSSEMLSVDILVKELPDFKLTSYIKSLLWRDSEEIRRKGGWERIFPLHNTIKYLKLLCDEGKNINLLFFLKDFLVKEENRVKLVNMNISSLINKK